MTQVQNEETLLDSGRLTVSTPAATPRFFSRGRSKRRLDAANSPSQNVSRHSHFPSLDILRGVAALSVVVCHCIAHFRWESFPTQNPLALWFRVGWIGVDLFFVISGLVITSSALNLSDQAPDRFRKLYLSRRLSRIVPLHYLTVFLYLIFITPEILTSGSLARLIATHLTFTHGFSPNTLGALNGPNWSLAVEMQFYLLVMVSLPLLRRVNPLALVAGAISIGWVWRSVVFWFWAGKFAPTGMNLTWLGISQLPGMLDHFGLGAVLGLMFYRDRSGAIRAFLKKTRWLWPVITALAATVVMKLFWQHSAVWDSWWMVVAWRTLLAGVCALVVLSACAIQDRWFVSLTAPLRYLGTISYGIYLWHSLVILALRPVFLPRPLHGTVWTLVITFALAAGSWHFFEKPFIERFRKPA